MEKYSDERFYKLVGEALKMYRERANITQSEATKRVGKGRTWLGNIENGIRSIYMNDMYTLCELYGCKMQDILDYYDKNK